MATQESGPTLSWLNIIATLAVILTALSGGWALFQSQLSSMERQFSSSDVRLDARIEHLERTRIERKEHDEFVKRIDLTLKNIEDQLKVIESTRPTTGELATASKYNNDLIADVRERLHSLEDSLRQAQTKASPAVPPSH